MVLVATLFLGGAGYVRGLLLMRARNKNKRDFCPLMGLVVAAFALPTLSVSSLSGWWEFSLSITFQAMSLLCGWWASARLRNPRNGEGESA